MIKRVFPPPIDLVKWYVIKDLMYDHNISRALKIAKYCKHPDAIWLFDICKDKNVKSISNLLKVLEPLNDERSLFFKWYIDGKNECCIESAKMGYIHAIHKLNDSNFKSVEECALKGERDAIYILGDFYEKDKHENLIYAASLNHQNAIYSVNLYYGMCPELRYIIGRARAISQDKDISLSYYYGPFYLSQNESCRKAVDTWSLISTRLRIYKDLRILIAKMIWETRFEALY